MASNTGTNSGVNPGVNPGVDIVPLNLLCNGTKLEVRLRKALLNIVPQIYQLKFGIVYKREDVLDVLTQIREYMAYFKWYGDEPYSDAWLTKLIEKILLDKRNAIYWNERSFNMKDFKNDNNPIVFLAFRIAEKIVSASAKSDPTTVAKILFERYGHLKRSFTPDYIESHNNPMVFIMNAVNIKRLNIKDDNKTCSVQCCCYHWRYRKDRDIYDERLNTLDRVLRNVPGVIDLRSIKYQSIKEPRRKFIISDDMKIGLLFAWINSTKSQTNSLGSMPLELIQKIIAHLYPHWQLTLPFNLYCNYIM
jgi:hypothetical protein